MSSNLVYPYFFIKRVFLPKPAVCNGIVRKRLNMTKSNSLLPQTGLSNTIVTIPFSYRITSSDSAKVSLNLYIILYLFWIVLSSFSKQSCKKAANRRWWLPPYRSWLRLRTWLDGGSDLRNFLWYKKAGNARWKTACSASCVLAYPSLACISTMQTARLILRNFPWYKKAGNARRKTACSASCVLAYRSSACIETMRNGEDHFAQFPMV